MRIYLDLLMGLNFTVDYLLLLGARGLAGLHGGKWRCAGAAALGAMYAGVCLLPGLRFLAGWCWRLGVLLVMGAWAFGPERKGWKAVALFALLTLALGGLCAQTALGDGWQALLCAGAVWALSVLGSGNETGGREYVPVEVTYGSRSVSVVALKDTGNGLKDPITGESVLVLGPEAAKVLLGLNMSDLTDPPGALLRHPGMGLRLVPYHSVGSRGMLLAGKFEKVTIGGKRRCALVAFAPERIGAGDKFQALAGGAVG